MKKRVIGVILCTLFLCLSFAVTALAGSNAPLVVDQADLLNESEESRLTERLETIRTKQQMDIVVVTVPVLQDKSAQDYVDDFYDENGYGDDGILLLISMEEREWYISTAGYGITAVTEAGLTYMSEQFVKALSKGDYYEAFMTYADLCDDFIVQARKGSPYDEGNLPKAPFRFVRVLAVSSLIGLVISWIVTGRMKGQLKTVHVQDAASDYIQSGSMKVTRSRDLFLYRNLNRQAKPKETRSGGTKTHTSSSGKTHGGGGGKF
ncbi:MAG: TPM domain-containing protein [Lachnospiraceae bacterium]|nr:TPM domain-containing protein [Lachnospiraceae bacterium]